MSPPLIWVLTGGKTGDNAQVLRAATAMDLPFVTKRIVLKPGFDTVKPKVVASLDIVDRAASDPLEEPWPDLVITLGRRLSTAALWVKAQSGGKSRIALFNAPKGRASDFDLIVAPAFYTVPDGPKLCRIALPLIAADAAKLAAARERFAQDFEGVARPLHVLLLGGDMGTRRLDPGFVKHVLSTMQQGFAKDGTIYATTSRRTPATAADAVAAALRPQDRLYRWREGAADNPYFGLLAHGASFTVTSDSLSMMTEVARLGRPLIIAEPPERPSLAARIGGLFGLRGARDLSAAAAFLTQGGHAVRLGDRLPADGLPPPDDTARVADRLRQIALGVD